MTVIDSGLKVYEYEDFGSYPPPPIDVYSGDLDANGLKDLIVIEHSTQMGSFLEGASTTILFKAGEREYRSISFEATFPGPEDFVDLDSDGRSEGIIPGFLNGTEAGLKHNCFTYSVYELRDFRLVNVDAKHAGFPKFVLFSNGPNDKDTITLDPAIRKSVTEAKDRSISYGTIKSPL